MIKTIADAPIEVAQFLHDISAKLDEDTLALLAEIDRLRPGEMLHGLHEVAPLWTEIDRRFPQLSLHDLYRAAVLAAALPSREEGAA